MLQRSIEPHNSGGGRVARYRDGMAQDASAGEFESLSAIIDILRRNLSLIAAVAIGCTLFAVVVALSISHQYRASVVVFIDPHRTQVFKDRDLIGAPGPGTDNGIVESEAEIMQSPALLRKVVAKLDLVGDPEFSGGTILGRIKSVLLWPVRFLAGSRKSEDPTGVVARNLSSKIDAKRRTQTYVIDLNAWSVDPDKAAKIANTLASLYLGQQVAAKEGIATETNRWLNEQVDKYRSRVEASDQAYEKYKAETGLFDPGGENLATRQIGQLNDQLVAARGKAAEARAKYEDLKRITPDNLDSAGSTTDALQSVVISNLRSQYADASRHRSELVTRYGPGHPQVQVAQAQIRDIGRQIREELSRIVASARSESEGAAKREASFVASLEELKGRAAQSNEASVRLHELEREAQANRDMFQAFLARAKETAAQIDIQLPGSRVVSNATPPVIPSFPPRSLIVALGLFLGLGLGATAAFGREMLKRGVRNVDDIEGGLGLPLIATIPLVDLRGANAGALVARPRLGDMAWRDLGRHVTEDIIDLVSHRETASPSELSSLALDQPNSPFAESIRSLQFAFKCAVRERQMSVVLVTSALAGEGKSVVSVSLARSLAKNHRVLLLDGDFRRPSLEAAFDIEGSRGIVDLLTGDCTLADALRKDPRTGLFVIPGVRPLSGSDAIAVASSNEIQSFLGMVREAFDFAIIDAAPLLPMADTLILAEGADGVLMVVAADQTSRTDIASALHGSPAIEEKMIGVVLNKAADHPEYYYGNERLNLGLSRKRA
jgi:capsular exopolysaccharide synthesis family protein